MVSVLQRARDSGKCPPSLLTEDKVDPDGFENTIARLLDTTGFGLASEMSVVDAFGLALKKATTLDAIQDPIQRASILEQRRCLILAIAGSTAPSSKTLERIVDNGYLSTVKTWLDEALAGKVGGVDLLLHLLTNIVDLPVTKSTVKDSGMGKAIGTIEKHSLCKGSANEGAIKERVANIKDAWQSSVKVRRTPDAAATPSALGTKRDASPAASPPSTKRIKAAPVEETKKTSSFSSLVKKAASSNPKGNGKDFPPRIDLNKILNSKLSANDSAAALKKKSSTRVKWADHFGGDLENSRVFEGDGENTSTSESSATNSVSWTDRKKRDRAREKELLASVKKAKLQDDEDDEPLPAPAVSASMKATIPWVIPSLLPYRTDVSKPIVSSSELEAQNERSRVVSPARYFSDNDVPPTPVPLSDIEQALDIASQSSAVVQPIPFFVPQQQLEPAPLPVAVSAPPLISDIYGVDSSSLLGSQPRPILASVGATPDLLQALGLPMFLVGQDIQALQTLASSPGLLSTMVDANGMYDQTRLLSLVQTLSGTPSHHNSSYSAASASMLGDYGSGGTSVLPYTPSPTFGGGTQGSSRGGKSDDEGNLHIAGYGPGTTQTDIITLFLPYVKVNEVVMKGTFAFVNTSDPIGAQRAKEDLQGTFLNGMPIRINPAQRKARDGSASSFGQMSTSAYGPGGGETAPFTAGTLNSRSSRNYSVASIHNQLPHAPPPPPPQQQQQQQQQPPQHLSIPDNVDHVRDDRGNPATKNLFVAGYGAGTTEIQLRDLFNQQANVIGVVLKGNFTFVNTSTREEAVKARLMLQGQTVNGGTLRINFAKETGRLGTSFDLTYNERSGPNAKKPPPGAPSYYGHGY